MKKQLNWAKIRSGIWTAIMPIIASVVTLVGIVCFFKNLEENASALLGLFPILALIPAYLIYGLIERNKNKKTKR